MSVGVCDVEVSHAQLVPRSEQAVIHSKRAEWLTDNTVPPATIPSSSMTAMYLRYAAPI